LIYIKESDLDKHIRRKNYQNEIVLLYCDRHNEVTLIYNERESLVVVVFAGDSPLDIWRIILTEYVYPKLLSYCNSDCDIKFLFAAEESRTSVIKESSSTFAKLVVEKGMSARIQFYTFKTQIYV